MPCPIGLIKMKLTKCIVKNSMIICLSYAIAFFAGLLISIGLCFLIEYMNNTFRTKEEIEDIIGLPTIGVIPDEYSFE